MLINKKKSAAMCPYLAKSSRRRSMWRGEGWAPPWGWAEACMPALSSSSWEWLEGVDTGSVMLDVDLGPLDTDVPFNCKHNITQ
jgi:hypothetical protein